LPQIVDTPEASRPLGTHGKQFWDRVWEMGSTWISSNTDYEAMLMTAEMVDERWNLRVKVMREGVARDRRALRDLDRAIQSQLSLLGLTPADRTRLGVAEVKKMSKLAELRQMRSE
jgi:selenocysteine lyase/cysteine desulfurase